MPILINRLQHLQPMIKIQLFGVSDLFHCKSRIALQVTKAPLPKGLVVLLRNTARLSIQGAVSRRLTEGFNSSLNPPHSTLR